MRKKKLEAKFEYLQEKTNKMCEEIWALQESIIFLSKHDRNDVYVDTVTKVDDISLSFFNCYHIKYFFGGKLKTKTLEYLDTKYFTFVETKNNDNTGAILVFDYEYCVPSCVGTTTKRRYYKLDKNTGDIIEVSDLVPAKETLDKAEEIVNSAVNNVSSMLADLFNIANREKPKTAKNVGKDTEKPAKNVGKKTTKKKESK